jgi:hypothetical protein
LIVGEVGNIGLTHDSMVLVAGITGLLFLHQLTTN